MSLNFTAGYYPHWILENFHLHILNLWKVDVTPQQLYETQTYSAQKKPHLKLLFLHPLQIQWLLANF